MKNFYRKTNFSLTIIMKKKNRETKRRKPNSDHRHVMHAHHQGDKGKYVLAWSRRPRPLRTLTEKELFAIAAKNKKETA